METPNFSAADDGKAAAIVSYLSIIGWLIAYFALYKDKETDLARYHLRQTLLFAIVSTVLYILLSIVLVPIIITTGLVFLVYLLNVLWIALAILWLIGLIGAIQGQKKPIPFIGEKAQSMFSSI
ncbi:DUF4870 domain-containing protein [Pedobacter sp. ASV12]|uniref:DUF4870 domain-containing protein n=1 Tax=Pedobacter sp. ASV12 TaxID=2795120 RepID=UPI0018EDC2ED|nr:DUF4870 domain-containing protein [Pedobacter sp. ASV12]